MYNSTVITVFYAALSDKNLSCKTKFVFCWDFKGQGQRWKKEQISTWLRSPLIEGLRLDIDIDTLTGTAFRVLWPPTVVASYNRKRKYSPVSTAPAPV